MNNAVVLKWVGWKLGYQGRSGWPAKDLSQEELDRRGLSKAELLAYQPRLYEEVRVEEVEPEAVPEPEVEEAKPKQKRGKRVEKEAVVIQGEADAEAYANELLDAPVADDSEKAVPLPERAGEDEAEHNDW